MGMAMAMVREGEDMTSRSRAGWSVQEECVRACCTVLAHLARQLLRGVLYDRFSDQSPTTYHPSSTSVLSSTLHCLDTHHVLPRTRLFHRPTSDRPRATRRKPHSVHGQQGALPRLPVVLVHPDFAAVDAEWVSELR